MASVQEQLQLKREPIDKWSVREQLCLASAVSRSGDQNWMSVSRALKPFGEANRPADWFHQKNCAAQYNSLLANVETPKRKKRTGETGTETPVECILKKLLAERKAELMNLLAEEKAEFKKLQEDMKLLQSGHVSEELLDKWCKEIDDEEAKREQEAFNRAKWLKQRELRKQEIERAWRPVKATIPIGQKRKAPDDSIEQYHHQQQQQQQLPPQSQPPPQYMTTSITQYVQKPPQYVSSQQQDTAKPGLSPLLTSLLKSPSQVQNMANVSNSILHSAITTQGGKAADTLDDISCANITSLLNNSGATMSNNSVVGGFPNCSDIGQDIDDSTQNLDLLDDANLKIDDLAKSILAQDEPFPEIKKEDVDDIISEIIDRQDIVADPEKHLQLDQNGDINISLELDEFEQEDQEVEEENVACEIDNVVQQGESGDNSAVNAQVEEKLPAQAPPVVDPFEFQEDPVLFESPVKPSTLKQENVNISSSSNNNNYAIVYQPPQQPKNEEAASTIKNSTEEVSVEVKDEAQQPTEDATEVKAEIKSVNSPAVLEVKDEDLGLAHKEAQEDDKPEVAAQESTEKHVKEETTAKVESSTSTGVKDGSVVRDLADDLYDDPMEVKIDKTGKAKRDYSRPKKREDKSFDVLLEIDKSQLEDLAMSDGDLDKKEKDNDRSNSPWTEEEEDGGGSSKVASKRRYSTPATPIDSFPNSPASSSLFEDDKEHRIWKKSVMLVYNRLASNKYASLFLKPITEEQAPGYNSVIYRPMDLQTIKRNIDNGGIRNSLEFKRDVMLMFTNAIMYNKTNDTVYNMTLQMQKESLNEIEILLQAERQSDAPLRRETRTSESTCKRKRVGEDQAKTKKRKED